MSASRDAPDMAGPGRRVAPEERAQQPPAGTVPTQPAGTVPTQPAGTVPTQGTEVPRTRTGAAFKTLIAGAIVLILLLVFILENTQSVKISYFGVSGHLPIGVALLIAAIGGALLVGIVGAARIVQLRHHVKRVGKRERRGQPAIHT